jgi:hypothetical protein
MGGLAGPVHPKIGKKIERTPNEIKIADFFLLNFFLSKHLEMTWRMVEFSKNFEF